MKKLFEQIIKFIGISGIGWIFDFIIFNILSLVMPYVEFANMISSLLAVTFVFIFSVKNTFKQRENGIPIKAKFVIYIVYQIILITMVSYLLKGISTEIISISILGDIRDYANVIAKILITPVTMALNFIVMKYVIEKM
jgi:putative flippase GtrA